MAKKTTKIQNVNFEHQRLFLMSALMVLSHLLRHINNTLLNFRASVLHVNTTSRTACHVSTRTEQKTCSGSRA